MNYAQWKKKYDDARGNPFPRPGWMEDMHARGIDPRKSAYDSRWILPHEFDAFIARVKLAKFEQLALPEQAKGAA